MADFADNATTTAVFEGNPLTGASFSGEFESFSDSDWIRVTLVAGKTYHFYGHAQAPGPDVGDLTLQLHDAAGTLLAADENSGVGYNSALAFTAAKSGTYFIEASNFQGYPGSYNIDVSAAAAKDYLL